MLKNQLYPFIESYINKYLWGFTKDQFEIGVTNGNIILNNLNFRPDTFNNFCNEKNFPFWLKFGQIKNVNITCSLMNIIGEKPLLITIENIILILIPSYKYIKIDHSKNPINKIDYIKEKRKINIFDNNLKIDNDENLIDKIIKNVYKFYNSKKYSLNLDIKNFQIKFEDDNLINPDGNFCFGLSIKEILINLSTEGLLKNYSFNINNLSFYFDNSQNVILIPSSILVENIDNLNKYYALIQKYNFDNLISNSKSENLLNIISNFSFKGNIGNKKIGKLEDIIIKQESSEIVYLNIYFMNNLEISIFPQMLQTLIYLRNFIENFEILKYSILYRSSGKLNHILYLINYVYLIRRMKKIKKENMVKKEYNRYMALYGYDKINRINEKTIGDDIIINKNKKINILSYPIFGIDYKNINLTPEEPNEDEEIVNLINKKRLNFIFKMIIPEFNFNLCNLHLVKCFSMNLNLFEINCQISNLIFEFKIQISNIKLSNEENFKTYEKEIPKFQYNLNKKKVENEINKNSNENNKNDIYKEINQRVNYFKAGLKESSLYNQSKEVQDSNVKLYKENSRYLRKMKILTETLNIPRDTNKTSNILKNNPSSNLYFKQNHNYYNINMTKKGNSLNKFREIRPGNFISRILGDANNSNLINNMILRNNKSQSNLRRNQQNKNLSNLINDYNTQKNNILNNSFNNINNDNSILDSSFHSNNIAPLYRGMINNNLNNSNINNSNVSFINQNNQSQSQNISKTPNEIFSLPFIFISSENKNNLIYLHYIKHLRNKEIDTLKINIPNIRINFFKEYFLSIFSVLLEYHINIFKKRKNKTEYLINFLTQKIHYHKALYLVRKHINETISNEVNINNGYCYNQIYYDYIKKVYNKYPIMIDDFETFVSNYLFSYYFSSNLEIDFNYSNFDFIFYKHNNNKLYNHQIFAHSKIQKIDFKIFYSLSYIYLKLFDFEMEVTEYDGVYDMILFIKMEIKNKLSILQKYFTKAFTEIRNEEDIDDLIIQLKNKDNNIEIDTERNININYQKYKIEIIKKKDSSNSKVPRILSKDETNYTSSLIEMKKD